MTFYSEVFPCGRISRDLENWIESQKSACPFSKITFNQAFVANSNALDFRLIMVKDSEGNEILGLPIIIFKRRGTLRVVQPAQYNPTVICEKFLSLFTSGSASADEALKCLDLCFQRLNIFEGRMTAPPGQEFFRGLPRERWSFYPAYTYVINLEKNFYAAFSSSCKNKVNKALRNGYKIKKTKCDTNSVQTMAGLLEKTFRRQGLDIKRLDQAFGGLDELRQVLLRLDSDPDFTIYTCLDRTGQPAAARVVARKKEAAYDWLAGNDPEHFRHGASNFMVAAMLEDLAASGCKLFDFGGANTPKISDFKREFGGEFVAGWDAVYTSDRLRHRVFNSVRRFAAMGAKWRRLFH